MRLCGAPIGELENLRTPGAVEVGRRLVVAEAAVLAEGRRLLAAAKRAGLVEKTLAAVAKDVQRLREPRVDSGLVEQKAFVDALRARDAIAGEAEERLRSETAVARRHLREAAGRYLPYFRIFAAEQGLDQLEIAAGEWQPDESSKERKRDRTLLLYLERAVAKNDTFSEFGPFAWGAVDPSARGLNIAHADAKIARRDVFWEKWVIRALAAAISADPEAAAEIAPRLEPAGWVDGHVFVHADDGHEDALSDADLQVLRRCDGRTRAADLGPPEILQSLCEKGILRAGLELPELTNRLLQHVRDEVGRWRDGPPKRRWLSTLERLASTLAEFAGTTDHAGRLRVMESARTLAASFGAAPTQGAALYRGANAIGERCMIEPGARIGEDVERIVTEEIAPWIDLWRDSYTLMSSTCAAGLRPLVESAPRVRGRRLLPAFLAHAKKAGYDLTTDGLWRLAEPAVQRIRDIFTETLDPRPDASEWTLTAEECRCVRTRLGFETLDEMSYPSIDLMLRAESPEASQRGDYEVVISELHPPYAAMGSFQFCPDPATLSRGLTAGMGDFTMLYFGQRGFSPTAHTVLRLDEFATDRVRATSPNRLPAVIPTVPYADTEVFIDEPTGDVRLRVGTTGEVIGSLPRSWSAVLAFHPFHLYRRPHSPRLRLGRAILQREAWEIDSSEIDGGKFDGFNARMLAVIERVRAAHRLPRWLFMRPAALASRLAKGKDHKPVMVDLESALGMDLLASWARSYSKLELVEMLPEPERISWRARGHAWSHELRMLVQPRR